MTERRDKPASWALGMAVVVAEAFDRPSAEWTSASDAGRILILVHLVAEQVILAATAADKSGDVLGAFLDECTRRVPSARVQASALHAAFNAWAAANGIAPWSAKRLAKEMSARGFASFKSSVMLWRGVELKPRAVTIARVAAR